ncbi:MAG: hypothetical protein WCD76_08755 [Pyrinomonadaceae bacterium]
MSGFSNQPKILRGAFVEFGLSLPPLFVVFQFNPVTITRTRTAQTGGTDPTAQRCETARQQMLQNMSFIQQVGATKGGSLFKDLRAGQSITVKQESITFDVRLDATDKLNSGDTITEQFGVAPQLSTLELMITPKTQSVLGGAVTALLGGPRGSFAFFSEDKNPPIILFIWGRKKILPVNITSMQIKEEEFSTDLNPIRATITVTLEVIEGPNLPFLYTKTLKEVMSVLNLANIADIANTIVPA